jgi:hypothetical protein
MRPTKASIKKRGKLTDTLRNLLLDQNAHRCCVCKASGVGFNLHHIDGDRSNTVEGNLAVLCVRDHDQHHRPEAYRSTKHRELSPDVIRQHKLSWEAFVADARSEHPSVLATVAAYGTKKLIHSAELVMQWSDRIEYRKVFHLRMGDLDTWTDDIIAEVTDISNRIRIAMISEPLPAEHCPCCRTGLSRTVDRGYALRISSDRWAKESTLAIFLNEHQPSIALTASLGDTSVFEASLHLCRGTHIHLVTSDYEERVVVRKTPSLRAQVRKIVTAIIADWQPANVIVGVGEPESPRLLDTLDIPSCWRLTHSSPTSTRPTN